MATRCVVGDKVRLFRPSVGTAKNPDRGEISISWAGGDEGLIGGRRSVEQKVVLLRLLRGGARPVGRVGGLVCRGEPRRMAMLGGVRDVEPGAENSAEIEELARFAVDEHNKKENALLVFCRVVKAKEQVVAGIMHHLTVEVADGGKKKLYEAKVWVQAWMNSKKLDEFKHIGDAGDSPSA